MSRVLGLLSVALALSLGVSCQRGATEDRMGAVEPGTVSAKQPAQGVRGRVVGAEGKPIVAAIVHAESLDNPKQAIPEIGVLTGKDGGYFWPLRPGRYRLTIKVEGYPPTSREVVVRPKEAPQLDFTLKK
jgi:hypothetical protein